MIHPRAVAAQQAPWEMARADRRASLLAQHGAIGASSDVTVGRSRSLICSDTARAITVSKVIGSQAGHTPAMVTGGADQPIRLPFAVDTIDLRGTRWPVATRDATLGPFASLLEFDLSSSPGTARRPAVLLVPPLSGQFAPMLRDMVVALVPAFRVCVVDWFNVRHVPLAAGAFGLDDNLAVVRRAIEATGRGAAVVAVCQGGTAALAVAAMMAADRAPCTPRALALIGAQIDPLANPTPVVRLIRSTPPALIEAMAFRRLARRYEGRGRSVYAASTQLQMLQMHLSRHRREGGELAGKFRSDDGSDPQRFPFGGLYTALMDIDARHFVENQGFVFRERALVTGRALSAGVKIDLSALEETALMTVEGSCDDIAAPGQTRAAHALCRAIPAQARCELLVPGAGHFGLFHGALWRGRVCPPLSEFCHRALCG